MDIRTATEADFDQILSLVNAAFQVERFFKTRDRLDTEELTSLFKRGVFLVTGDQGHITGCVYVERKGDRGYFGLLSIDPAHQKKGIGSRLVAAAEEFVRETGARFMDIRVVNLRTELPPIYQKLGYQVTGTEPYPTERNNRLLQPIHFILMTKELGHSA